MLDHNENSMCGCPGQRIFAFNVLVCFSCCYTTFRHSHYYSWEESCNHNRESWIFLTFTLPSLSVSVLTLECASVVVMQHSDTPIFIVERKFAKLRAQSRQLIIILQLSFSLHCLSVLMLECAYVVVIQHSDTPIIGWEEICKIAITIERAESFYHLLSLHCLCLSFNVGACFCCCYTTFTHCHYNSWEESCDHNWES
jgi:hypothetical protein